ncbi:hypothetical protein FRB99_001970 [Tulasnella sp. 403]|nr:hypothetical protein FRB99_001970 [Tulasnella sp. 403]
MLHARPLTLSRPLSRQVRYISATARVASEAPSASVNVVHQEAVRPKKPIGGFRGGIFGFLLGFSVASAYASYRLLEEYKIASALLQASVEELQASTDKVSTHIRRIENVERNLKALSESSTSKEESKKAKAELKKLYDGLHIEFLDLRAHVWGMQQDLHSLIKKESTSLRPT